MLRFKRFDTAAVTIRGIELVEAIRKHEFKIKDLSGKNATVLEMWPAILTA